MTLHIPRYRKILRGATDTTAGAQRELWEWLLAVAAMIGGVWISRFVGEVVFDLIIGVWRIG